MNDRTMIKVRCSKNLLDIWTISRNQKSPRSFAILRSELQQLEQRPENKLIAYDCGSYATLRLVKGPEGMRVLEIHFTWLLEDGTDQVHGWKEDVRLAYRPFHAFAEIGEDMDGAEWRQLSIPEKVTRHYEFHSRENLHEVVRQPILRRKLGKFLDQHFYWSGIEKIVIHDDGQPFSFFFQEYTSSGPGICGGIILHSAGGLQKSQYSIHT